MLKLVRLTHRKGEPIWINPEKVISLAPVYDPMAEVGGTAVTTERGTVVTTELPETVRERLIMGGC